ncbi:MAG: hypothetical protein ABF651_00020 [Sporolactobacillus sp.]
MEEKAIKLMQQAVTAIQQDGNKPRNRRYTEKTEAEKSTDRFRFIDSRIKYLNILLDIYMDDKANEEFNVNENINKLINIIDDQIINDYIFREHKDGKKRIR